MWTFAEAGYHFEKHDNHLSIKQWLVNNQQNWQNEIRTFSNKMMQKPIHCLARHPSSTLKNLEMVILILELEFMTPCPWACFVLWNVFEISNVSNFCFPVYISNTIHSGWYLKYIHEKSNIPNIPFKRISDYGSHLECIALYGGFLVPSNCATLF